MPRPSQALLSEGFFEFKKNAGEGMCWVKGCNRASRDDRSLCHMHEMRRWRAKKKKTASLIYPLLLNSFVRCQMRDHARARGIEYKITLDYWRGLVDAFGYYQKREDEVLSIDRVDATKGYIEGNIRVVSVSLNSYKSNKEKYLPEHVQHMLERKREEIRADKQKHLDLDPPEADPEIWDEAEFPEETETDDDCPF